MEPRSGRGFRHQLPRESGEPREGEKRLRERGEGDWEDPKAKGEAAEPWRPSGVMGRGSRERGGGSVWAASPGAIGADERLHEGDQPDVMAKEELNERRSMGRCRGQSQVRCHMDPDYIVASIFIFYINFKSCLHVLLHFFYFYYAPYAFCLVRHQQRKVLNPTTLTLGMQTKKIIPNYIQILLFKFELKKKIYALDI